MAAEDHPVWASLHDLLTEMDGETLATKYLLVNGDLTPFEFLSAASAQCFTMEKWAMRVELFKACLVAIRMGGTRVSGFAQSIFTQLVNVRDGLLLDDEYCCQLIQLYVEHQLTYQTKESATSILLPLVYDPLLTRVSNTELARASATRILRAIEHDLGTLTLQEIILSSAFAEREEGLEEDDDSEEEFDSLSDWKSTSDSTDSDISLVHGNASHSAAAAGKRCPANASAAACFFLAPNLIDPPILSAWGRFKWAQPASRYLMRNAPVKSLAAQRGFELFASFGALVLPTTPSRAEHEEDVMDMIVAAIGFATQLQNLICRNAVQDFIAQLSPATSRANICLEMAQDKSQLAPGIRAWALDVLRQSIAKEHDLFAQVQSSVLAIAVQEGEDVEVVSSSLALLRLGALLVARHGKIAQPPSKQFAAQVVQAAKRIATALREQEEDIDRGVDFQLRVPVANPGEPSPSSSATTTTPHQEAPQNFNSHQAHLGRARLAASFAESVLEAWRPFLL